MDFWEVVGLLVAAFVLAAYIVVLFEVVRDLLRDRDLTGWAKALWLVALVFLPILTTIVYVVVRGGTGTGPYGGDVAGSAEARQAQYARSVASPTEEISQAKAMWDSGVLDKAEFDALKMKVLS
ncbi:PLDc N-terminal domain-containing protein [Nocardioides sediminis]|uniref:PLDc N-terminal domain-containing protein n=1 Tax=Nocardioides sediminis TaxID=433648 RepID=UPI000D31F2B9|nr:PLDc N-terminal domain-containing protein [Nocardioides sediminis]